MGRIWQVVWTIDFTRQNLPKREAITRVRTGILRVMSKASIAESRLSTAVVPVREACLVRKALSDKPHFPGTVDPVNASQTRSCWECAGRLSDSGSMS